MTEKLPAPCEHCKGTGLSHGVECRECRGKGYRLIVNGSPRPVQQQAGPLSLAKDNSLLWLCVARARAQLISEI